MASLNTNVECRLAAHARFILWAGIVLATVGIRLPSSWVSAVTNRSWSMKIGNGSWKPIRIDNRGRIIK